ncbi:MAG: tRNA 2-thiouridine(34) synthase MnmA [Thermodesulfobacteriota bacterium]|nr:tRNA 2-thiouridine(34) synthase MnmA [Thermodesulfobacteriota bacterium]
MQVVKKVLVALSGGVDSAVTAALLLEQGYDVVGVNMQLLPAFDGECVDGGARQVARELGIEFHSLDCQTQFNREIVQNFCQEYFHGRTPNPCILCNRHMKFAYLLRVADDLGIEYLATGHYACVDHSGKYSVLRRGQDSKKDQSYFLFTLSSQQLSRVIFPLGNITKQEVQRIARRLNLSARNNGESQDICFIPDNDYISFLENQSLQLPEAGDIVHVDGAIIGHHQGIHRYTIGQRRGLGIGWSEPLYVVAVDSIERRVIVGEKHHLETMVMQVENVVWSQPIAQFPLRVDCRIRYRHCEALATISLQGDQSVHVVFDQPQTGVTPGQAAVFYQEDCVIGGGWIQ